MPVVEGREYRNIPIEQFSAIEGGYVVEGYATVFGTPYDFGGAKEVISPRALDGADMSDVIFQFDHAGMVMARQRNKTLEVFVDAHGLGIRADLSGCSQGRDLYEAIKNGLVDRMSWAFRVAEGGWSWDEASRTSTVERVEKVYDVSAVSLPACEATSIKARSYLDGAIEAARAQEVRERDVRARVLSRARLIR